MSQSQTPRADLVFAVVLTGFGGASLFESWRMPRLENLGINPLSAPGLTPGVISLVLVILGVMLLVRSRGAFTGRRGEAEGGWGRLIIALALCLAFALGLLGHLPFPAATAIFVFVFVLVFTLRRTAPVRAIIMAAALAVATAAAVTFLFQEIFLVQLP